MDMLDRILKAKEQQGRVTVEYAERMGYDAGKKGANTVNSHFTIFCRPEFTKAWERGKQRADSEKSRQVGDVERNP